MTMRRCDACRHSANPCMHCTIEAYNVAEDRDMRGVILFPRHKLDRKFLAETSLGSCETCGGAEASLGTHCPQRRMGPSQAYLISCGYIDFVCGRWVDLKPVTTTSWRDLPCPHGVKIGGQCELCDAKMNKEMT